MLFLLDFSAGLPEALPRGQQPEEGGVALGPQFTVAVLERLPEKRDVEG